jgi:hypothetical protein
MLGKQLRQALAVVLSLGLVAAVPLLPRAQADEKEKPKPDEKTEKKPDHSGIIAAVADNGRTITVELPPKVKGEAPPTVDIKLTDKTKVVYFGVDAAGENPTIGYAIQVWLADGSQDTATGVRLGRKDGDGGIKGPDFTGLISTVSKDSTTITVEIPPEEKGGESRKVEVKLTSKTKFSYFGVEAEGEKPTVGYVIQVWLAKGSKDTAVGVRLGLKE